MTSTLVSKENAKGNKEGVQDAVCQALFVAVLIAAAGTSFFSLYPDKTLATVLEAGAPAMEYGKIYLAVRSFSFLPALIALVGFSAFRGKLICVLLFHLFWPLCITCTVVYLTDSYYSLSFFLLQQCRNSRRQDSFHDQCCH